MSESESKKFILSNVPIADDCGLSEEIVKVSICLWNDEDSGLLFEGAKLLRQVVPENFKM